MSSANGDGRRDGGGGPDDGEERFSDWMGDARPLDKGKARVSIANPQPAKARAQAESAPASRFRFPDESRPDFAAQDGVSDQQLRSLARGEPAPEERIDLHGTRQSAAQQLLGKRFASARARGLRAVLVVHGYGKQSSSEPGQSPIGEGSVLKERLPSWLTNPPLARHVLAIAPAPGRLGGAGATMVLLRKPDPKT